MTLSSKFSKVSRDDLRLTLRLALPLIFAEIGWMSMGIVDTIMVGRLPNSAVAIGATGLGQSQYHRIAIFGGGLLLGLDTFVAQAFGREDLEDARHSWVNGLCLAFVLTPILMFVVSFWPWLMQRFGISPELVDPMRPFLQAISASHHVCVDLCQRCECFWRLGPHLWPPRLSGDGHSRFRMVDLHCPHLQGAGAAAHRVVGGSEAAGARLVSSRVHRSG